MRNIEFSFHDNVEFGRQKAVLNKINAWDSIESSGHVMPESTDKKIKHMAFAVVKDNADLEQVLAQLKEFSEIKSPVESPKRY
jgi:hypothetical protein